MTATTFPSSIILILKITLCFPDLGSMYPRHQATPPMHQQPAVFNQHYQPGPQNVMMSSQASNLQMSQQWTSPNPALSMDTVTINQSAGMSNVPLSSSSRQQQPNRGPGYPHRVEQNSCDNPSLPQLSMRDLQCLDNQATAMNQSESQHLFHLQHQRDELTSETRAQNHLGNQNQGLQTMWPSFSTHGTSQNTFNGSVPGGGGGGSQGMGSFPLLEGIEGDEFLKTFMVGSLTGFQLKQEPQMTVGQETHASLMQSPRDSQGTTYTNLLPRPISNGTNMDPMRQDGSGNSQPLKNLQIPYANSSVSSAPNFSNVTEWLKESH